MLEWVLFFLRLISAGLLLAILGVVFYVIWKDYRTYVRQLEASRRSYGQLLTLQEIEGQYILTGEIHPMLPITSLGRSSSNTVVVNDTFASGEHARMVLRDGQWWLEDCQSRNGTLLNEMLITQPVVITDGDVVGVGGKRYRIVLER